MAILSRGFVDRVPIDIWHTAEVLLSLAEHTGCADKLEIYRALGIDKIVWFTQEYREDALPEREDGLIRDNWGCYRKGIAAGPAVYEEIVKHPLQGFDTPESLDDYPWWPDPDNFDYEKMAAKIDRAVKDFAVMGPWVALFEIYASMRGLEQTMIDFALNPRLVQASVDRIESIQTAMLERFLRETPIRPDMVLVSDDMGGQQNLLISIETWKGFFGPRLERWCRLIHSFGLRVFYHSDGAVGPLIPHLINAGIDILNPIQHACPGMEMPLLKEKFGDRLIFHGGVDNQTVLPFGPPEKVREETRECLRSLGRGGGYICCSCHNLQPGTPIENIIAMIETVHREGGRWLSP